MPFSIAIKIAIATKKKCGIAELNNLTMGSILNRKSNFLSKNAY